MSETDQTLERIMDGLELRPHHIVSFADFEANKHYDLTPDEYINVFREKNDKLHNDDFILLWRDFLKRLYETDFQFKYVSGFDSVCTVCDEIAKCKNEGHEVRKYVEKLDAEAIERFPELKFGETYDKSYLRELFIQKGILRK